MCSFLRRFEVHVSSTDTVESVKEKVAASQLIAFPEHKLMFKGEKMEEGKTLDEETSIKIHRNYQHTLGDDVEKKKDKNKRHKKR